MSININGENFTTFDDYMNDENKVSKEEKAEIEFEANLICALIKLREEKKISQRELARLSGVKQPFIARIEKHRSTPQIDTLLNLLRPMGYTLAIIPIAEMPNN